jgi:hypothetical protein
MASARPASRRRAWLARAAPGALGSALALLGMACDFPEPEACALACGPAGQCPGAFECQPETLLCAPRGMREPCTSTLILPDEAPPLPDAGQRPPPSEHGTPGDAGGGSGPVPPPPDRALSIALDRSVPACTRAELALELEASGGEGPFTWRLLRAPSGVRLSAAVGNVVALAGNAESPGVVLVEIADAAGRRAVSEAIVIHDRPSIETTALPVVCAGAGYSVALDGWGGEADALVWSARLVTDDGRSLEDLGLEVDGSRLSGASIPDDLEPGTVRIELGASDDWCEADAVELELEVSTLDTDACPSIAIRGPASAGLPPPCRGNRYTEALTVEGGVPPFTWLELASSPGLQFDADAAVIDGIPSDDGELEVAVTDGAGRTVEARYDVRVRDRCWLAYVAGAAAPARLALVDPRLLERQPDNARRQFPSSGTAAVRDYLFSPDGRFVAYRSGPEPDALGVDLVRVADGATAPIELPEAAAEYAWSLDSALLFVATGSTRRVLHAVDVSRVGDADDGLTGLRALAPRSIPLPSSPVAAFGARALAFSTRDGAALGRSRLVTIGVEGSLISAPSTRVELDFSAAARVTGASAGVIVADPETGRVSFYPGDGRPPATHADALMSSSGGIAALARAGRLALFDAADAATPLFEQPGCARLLAGATARDRFACLGDQGALAFYELRPEGLGALPAAGPLGVSDLLDNRRVFSPAGRWFASRDGDGVSVWAIDAGGPRRAMVIPGAALGGTASTLGFSPDDDRLLIGAGNRLALLDLQASGGSLAELSASALLDEGCSERPTDGLEQWCGSDSGLSVVRWAPASDVVAFRSTLGTLTVIDVSQSREGRLGPAVTPDADCEEACVSSTSARFQP